MSQVTTRVSDNIATVEFSHPKGNSLPGVLLRRIADAIDELGADHEARVVVLRSGEPGPFCAGASFDELKSIDDEARLKELIKHAATGRTLGSFRKRLAP